MCQDHQSHLCSCLDNISPRPASTSTSAAASGCSIPRLWGCSCVTRLLSTKRTADFHSQVTSPTKNVLASALLTSTPCQVTSQDVLASAPLTFTHKSTHLSRHACKCTIDFHSQVTPLHFIPFRKAWHYGTVLFLWHSHLALASLILPLGATGSVRRMPTVGLVLLVVQYLLRYCNTSSGTGSHPTLSYLVCGASYCSTELVLATDATLLK